MQNEIYRNRIRLFVMFVLLTLIEVTLILTKNQVDSRIIFVVREMKRDRCVFIEM